MEREPRDMGAVLRALPRMYAVLDAYGAVLWSGADPHQAWRMLCDLDTARLKVDADDYARVFAHRGKKKTDTEIGRIANALVAGKRSTSWPEMPE